MISPWPTEMVIIGDEKRCVIVKNFFNCRSAAPAELGIHDSLCKRYQHATSDIHEYLTSTP
jgi:hypothetical protein